MLCRYAFAWPDLPAVSATSKCTTLRANPYLTCSQYTLSGILFHEMLHDMSLHDATNFPSMSDADINDFAKSVDPVKCADFAVDRYGPWNAMQL